MQHVQPLVQPLVQGSLWPALDSPGECVSSKCAFCRSVHVAELTPVILSHLRPRRLRPVVLVPPAPLEAGTWDQVAKE